MQIKKMPGSAEIFISCGKNSIPDQRPNIINHDGPIPVSVTGKTFRSESFGLVIVMKGTLAMKINFVTEKLKEKDILFTFPGLVWQLEPSEASFIKIEFSDDHLKSQGIFLSRSINYGIVRDLPSSKFSLSKEEYDDILQQILTLQKKLALPTSLPYFKEIVRNSFLGVFYCAFLINNNDYKLRLISHDSKGGLTTRFINLLTKNFVREKRVKFYANRLFVTSRHLSEVVKQVTGRTAGELIDEMVINEAKILLKGYPLNVSEVSEGLHFSNPSFFGKYFKKHTGISPSDYKLYKGV
jgi:AraC-like DNA-binding protein